MTTCSKFASALAVVATLTAVTLASGAAVAGGLSKGETPIKLKKNPIVNTIHPIIQHPPLHGEGSSHDPIVRNCDGPNSLCRRPL
jgi:hypothetical protein